MQVQGAGAKRAAVHRAEQLDIAHRVQTETLGQAFADDLDDLGDPVLRILGADKVKVAPAIRPLQIRHLALVDPMGIGDDPALGGLPEHLGQAHHRHSTRADDVRQHLPRPDRGQLVDIAHQDQGASIVHGLHQRVHQRHVDHRGLVDHQKITLDRVVLTALEPAGLRIDLQQTMDRLGLEPRGFGQPLGGPSGRRRQRDLHTLGAEDLEDGVDQGGLADPGPAGDHQHLRAERQLDRPALALGKGQARSWSRPRRSPW